MGTEDITLVKIIATLFLHVTPHSHDTNNVTSTLGAYLIISNERLFAAMFHVQILTLIRELTLIRDKGGIRGARTLMTTISAKGNIYGVDVKQKYS